jgi:hypothetical protein
MSFTEALQRDRHIVVSVDTSRGTVRVKGAADACTDLTCSEQCGSRGPEAAPSASSSSAGYGTSSRARSGEPLLGSRSLPDHGAVCREGGTHESVTS